MEIQVITFRGRIVAACTPNRVFFSDDLEARGFDDPLKRFVCAMCFYAGGIFAGCMLGRYRDEDARAFARFMLIPAELPEQPGPASTLNLSRAAHELGIPPEELFVQFGRALR